MKTFKQFIKEDPQQNARKIDREFKDDEVYNDLKNTPKSKWNKDDKEIANIYGNRALESMRRNPEKYGPTADTDILKKDNEQKAEQGKLDNQNWLKDRFKDFNPDIDRKMNVTSSMQAKRIVGNSGVYDDSGRMTGVDKNRIGKEPVGVGAKMPSVPLPASIKKAGKTPISI